MLLIKHLFQNISVLLYREVAEESLVTLLTILTDLPFNSCSCGDICLDAKARG